MANDPAYRAKRARESAQFIVFWWAAAWPATLLLFALIDFGLVIQRYVVTPINQVAWRPIDRRQARAVQLRADSTAWRTTADDETKPQAERDMASTLATMCEQQAKELA